MLAGDSGKLQTKIGMMGQFLRIGVCSSKSNSPALTFDNVAVDVPAAFHVTPGKRLQDMDRTYMEITFTRAIYTYICTRACMPGGGS
jgi:hypothetical protein